MNRIEATYGDSYFSRRKHLEGPQALVADAILEATTRQWKGNARCPEKIIEVGCGTGYLMKRFIECGKLVHGIEGSLAVIPHLVVPTELVCFHDLRMPFLPLRYDYDLCVSVEVAEHIEEPYATIFVKNLCKLSRRVFMTAAPPGQKGHGHVNCQERSYWIALMEAQSYEYRQEVVDTYQMALAPHRHKRRFTGYFANAMYFEQKDA